MRLQTLKTGPGTQRAPYALGYIGLAQDHSAIITAGAWQCGPRAILGVKDIKQFPIGTPLDEVVDFTAGLARSLHARVVFDSSNNSAFASILAARFGGSNNCSPVIMPRDLRRSAICAATAAHRQRS